MRNALRLTVYFLVLSSVISFLLWSTVQAHHAALDANRALCTLRHNFESQAHATIVYLDKHPNGAPALGLSRADLLTSFHKELAAADALRDVQCS